MGQAAGLPSRRYGRPSIGAYNLLSYAERTELYRLSVFADGCTVESASAWPWPSARLVLGPHPPQQVPVPLDYSAIPPSVLRSAPPVRWYQDKEPDVPSRAGQPKGDGQCY